MPSTCTPIFLASACSSFIESGVRRDGGAPRGVVEVDAMVE
tara:strand:+ start:2055 stop:2177 length:123 start_codon:yes stop_codon:yes gene_type:complete